MSVDVPKQVAQACLAVRNIFIPFPKFVTRGGVDQGLQSVSSSPDLQGNDAVFGKELILGGIYIFEILSIPPVPKKIKVREPKP